jgi:hypothetical protein
VSASLVRPLEEAAAFACSQRAVDPTPEEARADDAAYDWDLERFGGCPHKAAYPMGRWTYCIDCGEAWETRPALDPVAAGRR